VKGSLNYRGPFREKKTGGGKDPQWGGKKGGLSRKLWNGGLKKKKKK